MSLQTHQTVNGETTAFKCYRSFAGDGRGKSHSVVYVEVYEGYTTPGRAMGDARRTTVLRLTKEALETLSGDFAQLADAGEPDESPQNKAMQEWARGEL